jgi:hybrid cluster-associated redox disulfide protein
MSQDTAITKDTTITEAIRLCHSASEIFNNHGMGCFACMAASSETIEEGAQMHDIDVQMVVDELNAACGMEQ